MGENFIFRKRLFISQKCDTKHLEKILFLGKKFWNENACKTFGENVIENLKNFQQKIDKLSIRDWRTAEKVTRKLENIISFEQYWLKFWKKN